MKYQKLLQDFTDMCKYLIGPRLTGIYLHGSLAMGCFHADKSDIDLIVVINGPLTFEQKTSIMNQIVHLNERAPAKGLEISIVNRLYCKPFVYPTPYELHFSQTHLQRFYEHPRRYIEGMRGEDKDLAAHFTMINHYGITLYGPSVPKVFGPVPKKDYADSIWLDVQQAARHSTADPIYLILNLCRVLAFLRQGLYLSKESGGRWALLRCPERPLIQQALDGYRSDKNIRFDPIAVQRFSAYMLREIEKEMVRAGYVM